MFEVVRWWSEATALNTCLNPCINATAVAMHLADQFHSVSFAESHWSDQIRYDWPKLICVYFVDRSFLFVTSHSIDGPNSWMNSHLLIISTDIIYNLFTISFKSVNNRYQSSLVSQTIWRSLVISEIMKRLFSRSTLRFASISIFLRFHEFSWGVIHAWSRWDPLNLKDRYASKLI